MANNSTQKYIDIEKGHGFLSGLLPSDNVQVKPISEELEIDIDTDIEKKLHNYKKQE